MADVQDVELLKTSDEPPFEAGAARSSWLWLVVAALAVGAAAAAYMVWGRAQPAAPAAADQRRPEQQVPARPLGATAAPVNVPPLDQSDPVVRELVKQITSHPRIAAWLATDGLIRTVTVAIENVASGATPAGRFGVLRPPSNFEVVARGRDLHISPRSYQRYDELADAMASIDAAGAARLYATLKPRIEEAYRDLGYPDASFDRALEQAIVLLLKTPASDARIEPKGIGYGFADPALEGLTGAQKQLLRTGPRNIKTIQASLRQIALALGIPVDRLPMPTT